MKILATLEEYKQFLADNGDKLIVIDFYADWCGPCKMIAPKIEAFEKEFEDVLFAKVNVDENEDTSTECDIKAMPTFQFMKNNKKVDEITGANEVKIKETIMKHK